MNPNKTERRIIYQSHPFKDGSEKIFDVIAKLVKENLKDFLGASILVGTLVNKIEKYADNEILLELIKKAKEAKDILKIPGLLFCSFLLLKKGVKLLNIFSLKDIAIKKLVKNNCAYTPLYIGSYCSLNTLDKTQNQKKEEQKITIKTETSEITVSEDTFKATLKVVKKDIACKRFVNFTFFIPAFLEKTNSFAAWLANSNIALVAYLPYFSMAGGILLTTYASLAIFKESCKLIRAIKKLNMAEESEKIFERYLFYF
jgi:hypothetical protein